MTSKNISVQTSFVRNNPGLNPPMFSSPAHGFIEHINPFKICHLHITEPSKHIMNLIFLTCLIISVRQFDFRQEICSIDAMYEVVNIINMNLDHRNK